MVADVLDALDLLLPLVLPIVDIVDRILALQPLQKGLVLRGDALSLLIASGAIQGLCNVLPTLSVHVALGVDALATFLFLEGGNRRHIAFLVLGEVLAGACQDAGHALEQHAVLLFDLGAPICQRREGRGQ